MLLSPLFRDQSGKLSNATLIYFIRSNLRLPISSIEMRTNFPVIWIMKNRDLMSENIHINASVTGKNMQNTPCSNSRLMRQTSSDILSNKSKCEVKQCSLNGLTIVQQTHQVNRCSSGICHVIKICKRSL